MLLVVKHIMAGPALPWACPDTPANDGSAPSKDQKELSLKAGDRVKVCHTLRVSAIGLTASQLFVIIVLDYQVLWEIHSDEGESSTKVIIS